MSAVAQVYIGDRVRYESAQQGTICGTVVKITRDFNHHGYLIDWIYVEYYNEKSPSKYSIARLATTDIDLMGFTVMSNNTNVQSTR